MKIPPTLFLAALSALLPLAACAQDAAKSVSQLDTGIAREISAKDAAERKAAPQTLDEIAAAAKQDNHDGLNWSDDEGNAGFDDATRARIRILSAVGPLDGMRHFKVVFDPKLGVRDDRFEFRAMNRDVRLLRVRGVKKYVVLDYGVGSQYYDATNFARYVQHVYDPSLAYQQAGSYSTSNGQMQDVTDADVMADALTRFMKVNADDPMIATLRDRVKRNANGRPYIINGNAKTLFLGVGDHGLTIWPDEKKY